MTRQYVDGVLVQWGERLFYPSNHIVKSLPAPRLDAMTRRKAAVIRQRIEATVRWAPQVMVKVTGGGRGMAAIAAHFRYISKNGRLAIEDDRGVARTGKEVLCDLADQWRYGGSFIGDLGHRREAFNIMLSMPAGTNAALLKKAAREFARTELAGHRYVMVLHEHQANPHVHLSVKAEGISGKRLNPRKADLHRWRETFAEKLRGWGIEAEATRQATRGENRNYEPLWRLKAKEDGRLRAQPAAAKAEPHASRDGSADAMFCWGHIWKALEASDVDEDRALAKRISSFVRGSSVFKQAARRRLGQEASVSREPLAAMRHDVSKGGPVPKLER
ncbi:relaxase/mobilization nuclease domain-containing protein [Pelomonas sp. Root1444]|uniref:relaxase/mobilization nuclease domain-containing protein n=1 Tax=Pelomonas sp. Root1444 TaxID=1736464 RepID=UPI000A97CA3B|nr:relaxase/mobilization nuclease domain-containing protein [Pelomonas sp. Root1444]